MVLSAPTLAAEMVTDPELLAVTPAPVKPRMPCRALTVAVTEPPLTVSATETPPMALAVVLLMVWPPGTVTTGVSLADSVTVA